MRAPVLEHVKNVKLQVHTPVRTHTDTPRLYASKSTLAHSHTDTQTHTHTHTVFTTQFRLFF